MRSEAISRGAIQKTQTLVRRPKKANHYPCWAMKAAGVIVCPKCADKLAVFFYISILLACIWGCSTSTCVEDVTSVSKSDKVNASFLRILPLPSVIFSCDNHRRCSNFFCNTRAHPSTRLLYNAIANTHRGECAGKIKMQQTTLCLFSSLNLFPLWCEEISDFFISMWPLRRPLNKMIWYLRVTPVKVIEDRLPIFTTAASINEIHFALSCVFAGWSNLMTLNWFKAVECGLWSVNIQAEINNAVRSNSYLAPWSVIRSTFQNNQGAPSLPLLKKDKNRKLAWIPYVQKPEVAPR
jgi:hypothetical protein